MSEISDVVNKFEIEKAYYYGCKEDLEKAYQQGRADAFQEIAYSDSVIKEPFETLAYKKGRADGARDFAEKIKSEIEGYWYRSELDMGAENVNSLIDCVLAEWQKGAEE